MHVHFVIMESRMKEENCCDTKENSCCEPIQTEEKKTCCSEKNVVATGHYVIGSTGGCRKIPVVSTDLNTKDVLGAFKVRWSIGRSNYRVLPGLYAVGAPDKDSDVFVSANYKLSFDHLRKNLKGINAWILVLDTKGVNVWCAAGKGTFGTKELVSRIISTDLGNIVAHRRVIVPQLGAVGISAHQVKEECGFRVVYGPVRADDIALFVKSNYRASMEMRRVLFTVKDRVILTPVEMVGHLKYYLILLAVMLGVGIFDDQVIAVDSILKNAPFTFLGLTAGYIAGAVLVPVLLPWIPFRNFSLKGMLTGALVGLIYVFLAKESEGLFQSVAMGVLIIAITSFIAMNFTGSSTFTSLSGVKKEMKSAVPVQIFLAMSGFVSWVVLHFV